MLKSLVKQTEKRFEVIVVDDGSQEASDEVVAAFKDKLPFNISIKKIPVPGHQGIMDVKNQLLIFLFFLIQIV